MSEILSAFAQKALKIENQRMMKNRLKFRAWDVQRKRMSLPFNLADSCLRWRDGDIDMPIEFGVSKNRLTIQQFTNLKDSTGKDIYEGDIVEKDEEIGQIGWNSIYAAFHFDQKGKQSPLYKFNRLTIIGNIFETPDLLK